MARYDWYDMVLGVERPEIGLGWKVTVGWLMVWYGIDGVTCGSADSFDESSGWMEGSVLYVRRSECYFG